jgi:hypothetical protein
LEVRKVSYLIMPGDVLEARIVTFDPNLPTQLGENVLHYVVNIAPTVGVTTADVATYLDSQWAGPYKALLSSACQYRGTSVQKVQPLPRAVNDLAVGAAANGGLSGNMTPTQVAAIIRLETALAGRPFRGRIYVPFMTAGAVNAVGNMTSGYFTLLTALAAAIPMAAVVNHGLIVAGIGLCIWHRKGYHKPPINVGFTDAVTAVVPTDLFATQRRRGNLGRVNNVPPF